jgi:hypothetical protein
MPRFYFDFHGDDGSTIDDDGAEFPNIAAARKEALVALGDAARDFTRRYSEGRLSICVRDGEGLVLEVLATFEAKLIRRKVP